MLTRRSTAFITLLLISSCGGDPPASDDSSIGTSTGAAVETGTTSTAEPTTSDAPGTTIAPTSDGTTSGTSGETTTDPTSSSSTGGSTCGDGVQDPDEACDNGPDNGDDQTCKLDCSAQTCGDGHVGPGEGCDDGNNDGLDGCSAACVLETCGDGVQQDGEACDDGANGDPDDGCTDACTEPACGDGFVQESLGETCDEAEQNSDAGNCTLACQSAYCGDGKLQDGNEECDDAKENGEGSPCTTECTAATCGDGVVLLGVEECDDGNVADGDGCAKDCKLAHQLSLGDAMSCVLKRSAGTVHCWGSNASGQLGLGTTTTLGDNANELPTAAINLGAKAVEIAVSDAAACARLESGKIKCWGHGELGQLGLNNTQSLGDQPGELPSADALIGASALALAGGGGSLCARVSDDAVRCWGSNDSGKLGLGNTNNLGDSANELPAAATDVGFKVHALAVGRDHACAVSDTGALRCWGGNGQGQLGLGDTNNRGDAPGELPTADIDFGTRVIQVVAGDRHTCALLATGRVRCWGRGLEGQLGLGDTESLGDQPGELPVNDIELDGDVSHLAAGGSHTCARLQSGAVQCWGLNELGQLGIGSAVGVGTKPGDMPPMQSDLGTDALTIVSGGYSHTCAILKGGVARCWGANTSGQLGIGSTSNLGDNELPSAGPTTPLP